MATSILVKSIASSVAACAAETIIASKLGLLGVACPTLGLPAAFAGVIAVNGIGSTFLLMGLGMKVGMARSQYNVQYPTVYATGTDANSIKFNCIQRGHQQALETYTSFVVLSLLGGATHPFFVTAAGIAWIVGRWKWAEGYATGDPTARYTSMWSRFVWYSLLGVATAAMSTAVRVLTGLY
mmetsp:Transcript_5516/g.15213  ORF Transcript_5516/g.15213 Transcript_5516/m.15213 type:complete len:182 (-) Transcript_5516:133-678(-)|eukprot:CAMPEP_0185180388 /NCGR_PEP_ID=MMETSP1139-20130426/32485_1 /TAXON_ID=298111 /ORGANISM="Pavlova sp., Strain CCMP459" /LENGTH=181 /DNA_ID=CAMNT_0027746223 /DNA_START=28 /DNA_END=573 /DNA_ORIENTATION=+